MDKNPISEQQNVGGGVATSSEARKPYHQQQEIVSLKDKDNINKLIQALLKPW